MLTITNNYCNEVFSDLTATVDRAIAELSPRFKRGEFDTLIGTGLSGGAIVPMLAEMLGCDWALVRKENARCHSTNMVEGTIGDRWVFVDDFIATGTTFARCVKAIGDAVRKHNYILKSDREYARDYSWCDDPGPDVEMPVNVGMYLYAYGGVWTSERDYDYRCQRVLEEAEYDRSQRVWEDDIV